MNDEEKVKAIIKVIEKLDEYAGMKWLKNHSPALEVKDFEDAIYDMREILGIIWLEGSKEQKEIDRVWKD